MTPRILIGGIGNIFFGDDAFGVEVARELAARSLPEGVRVIDFGIRSYDLAYALTDDYDAVILVDAVPRGESPGTLFLIEPELEQIAGMGGEPDGHSMNAVSVLRLAQTFGGITAKLYLVGCEPLMLEQMELSETVRAAVPRAVEMIEELVREIVAQASRPRVPAPSRRPAPPVAILAGSETLPPLAAERAALHRNNL